MRLLKISLAILIALVIYQLLHWTTGITWPWTDYLYPYMVIFALGPIFFRYIHIVKQWDKEEETNSTKLKKVQSTSSVPLSSHEFRKSPTEMAEALIRSFNAASMKEDGNYKVILEYCRILVDTHLYSENDCPFSTMEDWIEDNKYWTSVNEELIRFSKEKSINTAALKTD